MNERAKKKSVILMYLSAVLQFQGFISPVIYIFYVNYMGLTTAQCLFCDALLFFIMAFVEIPSGMLADHFGRKKTVVISKIAIGIGMAILILFNSFSGAVIVAIIYGIFGALDSGVKEAIYYEIFEETNSLEELEFIQAKTSGIGFAISIAYSFAGGILGDVNIVIPVILDLVVTIVTLAAVIILLEDHKKYKKLSKMNMPSKNEITNVLPIIGITSIVFSCSRTLFSFYKPLLVNAGASSRLLGISSAMYSIVAALTTTFYKKIRSNVTEKMMYAIIIILQFIATMGVSFSGSLVVLVFILIQQVQRGIAGTYLYMQTNNYISTESGNRVTLMSIMYFSINIIVALSLFIISMLTDALGLSVSVRSYSTLINILLIIGFVIFEKRKKENKIVSYEKRGDK